MTAGIATMNPIVVSGYTVTASIVNTVIPINTPFLTPPPPPPQLFVVEGTTTSAPDNPGMVSYPVHNQLTLDQSAALRSAAINTALAFGLSPTNAADQATKKNNKVFLGLWQQQPSNVIDETIVPP